MKLFNILGVISLSLITFVIGTIVSYYLIINHTLSIDTTIYGSYISGFGSFLGGLFGGIIAYFVAKAQLLHEKSQEQATMKAKYRNFIKALKIEIEHNIEVFELVLEKEEIELREKYCLTLEDSIWSEIRFNIINLFDLELYTLLNIHFKECNDLKQKILPEYQNFSSFDFKIRIDTAKNILSKIQDIDDKLLK